MLDVVARDVVGGIVPSEEVTGGVGDGSVSIVIYHKEERDDGVTAEDVSGPNGIVMDRHRSVERSLIDETVAVVGASSADGVFKMYRVNGIDRQS